MRVLKFLISFLFIGLIFICLIGFIISLLFNKQEESGNLIGVIYLKGVIVNEEGKVLLILNMLLKP
jgi:hypothetical protein